MLDLVRVRLRAVSSILRRLRPAWWMRRRIGTDEPGGRRRRKQSMLGLSLIVGIYGVVAFAGGLLVIHMLRCEWSTGRLVLNKHMTMRCAWVLAWHLLRGDAREGEVDRLIRVHMGVPLGGRVHRQFPTIAVAMVCRRARCSGLGEEATRPRAHVRTGLGPVSIRHGVRRSVRHTHWCIVSGVGQRRLASPGRWHQAACLLLAQALIFLPILCRRRFDGGQLRLMGLSGIPLLFDHLDVLAIDLFC